MLSKKPFRSVNIPSVLINKVEVMIKEKDNLYPSIARFVEDAVRRHIEYVEKKNITDAKLQKVVIDFVKYIQDHSKND